MTPRILVFAGSTRTGAYSGKTADAAMKELALQGADVTRISLADYPLPLMNQDLEREKGVPEDAVKLAHMIGAHDAVLIATPEYNASIPPLLKNTVDWVSRVKADAQGRPFRAFSGKLVALCSSSDGGYAGVRAINHLRAVLVHCQADVITPQCSVPRAQEAFDEKGDFREERLKKSMAKVCGTLIAHARLFASRATP
ncbi:NAD(P)H-dependent oxidoreductase [Chelativorans sp. AA-79]|uniref:NADPH-dependent FMN reductase n=1 Tax=Chelativorans sp. AA-79 TaxID=3028735 RepID=UPI0023F92E79|nr:NAD(P)H-dependent oxidoreductase [Chelativorans sp. AA-79]WEX08143.1 NAD(P)H-dependent oxidoreductase [Chelativorans sp. AA-79]